jgi:hypothetical protein
METNKNQTEIDYQQEAEELIVSSVSPYRLTQILEVLCGRFVRPQVIYSYVRDGKMLKGSKNSVGKWEISREEAIRFAVKYSSRNSVR